MTSLETGAGGRAGRWRRSPSRGDLRYDAILDEAERLLTDKALRDITIDEIARGAGITRPTFYFYFDSKYTLLAALVEKLMSDKFTAAGTWFTRPPELSPREALERTYTDVMALWRAHAAVVREAADAVGLDPDLRSVYLGLVGQFVTAATGQIERERAAGLAPRTLDANALATNLIWMGERSLYGAVADIPPVLADRERISALVEIWLCTVYGNSPHADQQLHVVATATTSSQGPTS